MVSSCVNIFAALTLLSVIANRQGSIAIEKKEWDLQTVTASDYCLELSLSKDQVEGLRAELNQERFLPRESDGLRLKLYLIKKLEELLKQLSGEDGGRIADVNFAYYNSWLLDGLRDRGDAIKYQQWDKLNEQNKKLTERIHSDMQNLITPKCAFISIESETHYNYLSDVETMNE